jgi:xanthine dehydrogenase accessory factor
MLLTVMIRGGGEVASAAAHRLHRSGFHVCMTEIEKPLAVSRGTCFCEAVYDGSKTIEGVTAELVQPAGQAVKEAFGRGHAALAVDPEASLLAVLKPDVFIDAAMIKKKTATSRSLAPLVLGLGPGFRAGEDVHAVVETLQGNTLGRVILQGEAEPNTAEPIKIAGLGAERVLWAAGPGLFTTQRAIGDRVEKDDVVGFLGDRPLAAPLGGMLRGLLRPGTEVPGGAKLLEVDPENDPDVCFVIRDRMRAIAGGVLEAVMMAFNSRALPS